MRTLRITSGPAAGQEMELESELTVGREGADLVIVDDEMSRRHAVLRPVDGGVEVEDLGSTNGTLVDGRRISAPVTIAIRGAVQLGNTEIKVNVALPQESTMGSSGQTTRAAEVQPPLDATAPRQVPSFEPDVTAPRQVPSFEPDVTAPRQVPSFEPDVTAPRQVPQPPAPQAPAPAAPAPAPAAGGDPGPGEQSRFESPNLPLAASYAIFAAALIAVVAILLLFG